jgi:hypothetical protein
MGRRNTKIGAGMTLVPGGQKQPKYDEAEFLVGGKGTGPGDTVKESFRIHEGYLAEVQRLVQAGVFPYETWSDLYRHAVVRHVEYLTALEPHMEGSVLYQLRQIDAIVAREQFNLKFMKNIASVANVIRQIIEIPGGKEEIGRMIRQMRKQIMQMDRGFWRSYYETLFMREFGGYINSGLVVLSQGSDSDDEHDTGADLSPDALQRIHEAEAFEERDSD